MLSNPRSTAQISLNNHLTIRSWLLDSRFGSSSTCVVLIGITVLCLCVVLSRNFVIFWSPLLVCFVLLCCVLDILLLGFGFLGFLVFVTLVVFSVFFIGFYWVLLLGWRLSCCPFSLYESLILKFSWVSLCPNNSCFAVFAQDSLARYSLLVWN